MHTMRISKAQMHSHTGLPARARPSRGSSSRLRQLLLLFLVILGWALLSWHSQPSVQPFGNSSGPHLPPRSSSPSRRVVDRNRSPPTVSARHKDADASIARNASSDNNGRGQPLGRSHRHIVCILAIPLDREVPSVALPNRAVVSRIGETLQAALETSLLVEVRLGFPGCPGIGDDKSSDVVDVVPMAWFGYCHVPTTSSDGGSAATEEFRFSVDGFDQNVDAVVAVPRWWLSSVGAWDRHLDSVAQLIRSALHPRDFSVVQTIALVRTQPPPSRRADSASFAMAASDLVLALDGLSLIHSTLDGGTVLHPRGWGRPVDVLPEVVAHHEDAHPNVLRRLRVVDIPFGIGWGTKGSLWRRVLEWLRTEQDARRLVASTVQRDQALLHFNIAQLLVAAAHALSCADRSNATVTVAPGPHSACRWNVSSTAELDAAPSPSFRTRSDDAIEGDGMLLQVIDDLAGRSNEWRRADSGRHNAEGKAVDAALLHTRIEPIALGVASLAQTFPRDAPLKPQHQPRSAAEVVSSNTRLYWDPFCSCTGINIEAINFLVPLDERMPVRAVTNADCWCNGFPALDPMTLARIRRPVPPPATDEAISLWVTHKPVDFLPSFPYHGAIRFDRRPSRVIARLMIEHDRFSASAVARLSRRTLADAVDEIWVPSPFLVEVLRCSGLSDTGEGTTTRVVVIPEAIDVAMFNPRRFVRPSSIVTEASPVFRFLSNFKWEPRKGWDLLLEAYLREFRRHEPVSLVLKTYLYLDAQPRSVHRIQQRIIDFTNTLLESTPELRQLHSGGKVRSWADFQGRFPGVDIVPNEIPALDMPAFYAAHDAFVLPSRGEGWGLPYQEAMAMGLPCIGTRWSGMLAFMNDDNSFLINVTGMEPSTDSAVEHEIRVRARLRGDRTSSAAAHPESEKVLNGQDAKSSFAFYRDSVFGVPVDDAMRRTLIQPRDVRGATADAANVEGTCEPRRDPYWAVPDLDHLRVLLRHVFDNRASSAERGRRARRDMEQYFSREVVADIVAKRVLQIITEIHVDAVNAAP